MKILSLAVAAVFAISSAAQATTYQFAGEMLDGDIPSGVSPGDPFSGTFTLDTAVPPEPGPPPGAAFYFAATSFSVSINGVQLAELGTSGLPGGVFLQNFLPLIGSPPPDRFSLNVNSSFGGLVTTQPLGGFYTLDEFQITLTDFTNFALSSLDVPTDLELSKFGFATARFDLLDATTPFSFNGVLTSLSALPAPPLPDPPSIEPVPLPASGLLLAAAMIGMAHVARRRSTPSQDR